MKIILTQRTKLEKGAIRTQVAGLGLRFSRYHTSGQVIVFVMVYVIVDTPPMSDYGA